MLSVSWGGGESNYPVPSMVAANVEFQKMGLLGISTFAASGDAGTGKQGLFKCKAFDATYLASSPFVTAVGGIYLDKDTHVEHGWSDSGGGFSAIFGQPSYQQPGVTTYLQASAPKAAAGLYNASGRALPDVAALSTNFQIVSGGAYGPLSGTSAATPCRDGLGNCRRAPGPGQARTPLHQSGTLQGHGLDRIRRNRPQQQAAGMPRRLPRGEGLGRALRARHPGLRRARDSLACQVDMGAFMRGPIPLQDCPSIL